MRVVLGYSATAESEAAAALVASLAWPRATEFHLIHAVATRAASAPDSVIPGQAERVPTRLAQADAEKAAHAAGTWLDSLPGTHFKLRYGNAAVVLAGEARLIGADLLVVGSRRRGPLASFVLGSVSTAAVDDAPCPVLIARKPTLVNVVVATDGSENGQRAVEIVGRWPMFERTRIAVVSVGDSMHNEALDHVTIAAAAARQLRSAGRHARATSRVGDASRQILDVAKLRKADLIVLGSRGHTGISRALLGSTAREVLLATDASVIVCPTSDPASDPSPQRA
jgi:nucleotide-binding universal stress UspA family protein